jgi:hypothetical protein
VRDQSCILADGHPVPACAQVGLYLELQPVQCAGVCDHWLPITSTATMPALRKGLSVVNRWPRTQYSATPQEIATWTKGFAFRSTVVMRKEPHFLPGAANLQHCGGCATCDSILR